MHHLLQAGPLPPITSTGEFVWQETQVNSSDPWGKSSSSSNEDEESNPSEEYYEDGSFATQPGAIERADIEEHIAWPAGGLSSPFSTSMPRSNELVSI